jgi:hypothetical protein
MKRIEVLRVTPAEANDRLGVDMEPAFWEALVRLIDYPELVWEAAEGSIAYPSYVPFDELAKDFLEGIEQGIHDIRLCEVCGAYCDVDKTDGIFGNVEELTEFICAACADTMTARDYYTRFLAR